VQQEDGLNLASLHETVAAHYCRLTTGQELDGRNWSRFGGESAARGLRRRKRVRGRELRLNLWWKKEVKPQESKCIEVPHARAPVLAAAEEQELAGVIVYGTNRAVVGKLGQLFA
jgi:hypothetical protein